MVGLGASGGLAAAPLPRWRGPEHDARSFGSLAGTAGQVGGLIGQGTGQEWLADLGKYLGAAGGIAGGVGGLANSGQRDPGPRGRGPVASNAGRVVGVGTLADSDVLTQGGGYLGAAGQLGSGVETIRDVFGGGVRTSPTRPGWRVASGRSVALWGA